MQDAKRVIRSQNRDNLHDMRSLAEHSLKNLRLDLPLSEIELICIGLLTEKAARLHNINRVYIAISEGLLILPYFSPILYLSFWGQMLW